jgi:tRNA-binding protein
MEEASFDDFLKIDMRVGRVIRAEEFPEARKPAWKMWIDFGREVGEKRSSAQITNYSREELEGRLVVAVVNFSPRQIGPFVSEVLVLGAPDEEVASSCCTPTPRSRSEAGSPERSGASPDQATGARPITLSRRSRHFIAKARVSSGVTPPNSSVSPSTYH